jgi:hypothetical protein
LILAGGFLIDLIYTVTTGYDTRQHDLGNFGDEWNGHLNYIYHFVQHWTLPERWV